MSTQSSADDNRSHYNVIIIGTGVSGMAAAIQLKRRLGISFEDIMLYEKDTDIGGTWHANVYPGAACDIPVSFYSFSFAPSADFHDEWASQPALSKYLHQVQKQYELYNIVFETLVTEARFSNKTGLWTVELKDLKTKEIRTRTCNVLVTATGPLSLPKDPPFDTEKFDGDVFHTARWRNDVSLDGKDVVLLGNGCTSAQIVPNIVNKVNSLTQVARGRQHFMPPPAIPSGDWLRALFKWVPGLLYCFRAVLFWSTETAFKRSDIVRGKTSRESALKENLDYVHKTAPQKYWKDLEAHFDVGSKRRIFDNAGYLKSMHNPKFDLIQDDVIASASGRTVKTKGGRELEADVIILSTGFKATEFLFPLRIFNGEGEALSDRFKQTNASTYYGTMVHGFPSLFILMGPNTTTGHSSVIFTAECQVNMMLRLIKPVLEEARHGNDQSRTIVQVTKQAESRVNKELRNQMKNMVWENQEAGGTSWYVDDKGLCTTLQAFSQYEFWKRTRFASSKDFVWSRVSV